jgi:hypothetical protein
MTKSEYYFGIPKSKLDSMIADAFYDIRIKLMRELRTELLNDPKWSSNPRIDDITTHIKKWEDILNDKDKL